MSATTPSTCACTDTRVLRASGRDARAFLQGQLTRDIVHLGTARAALAAWLDARGRVLTLLEVIPDAEDWLLVVPADLAETVQTRLGRYILRADVELALEPDIAVHAILGDAAGLLAERAVVLDAAAWSLARTNAVAWLRIGPALVRALAPPAALATVLDGLPTAEPPAVALAEIRLGLPRVDAASSGKYIPQMLDLDRLGALSFDKGCYPGQEIVARTQNLGSVKRRLARFGADSGPLPAAGTRLSDSTGEPAGEVLRAADTGHGIELLAVVRNEAAALRLDSSPARTLERLALPAE